MVELTPEQVSASPPPPYFTSLAMAPTRFMGVAPGRAILHHACNKIGIDDYWAPDDWWACQARTRPLDTNTRFDQNCLDCGQRWVLFEAGPLSLKGEMAPEHVGDVWIEGVLRGDADACPVCDVALRTAGGTRLISHLGADGVDRWECPDCGTAWQKDLRP